MPYIYDRNFIKKDLELVLNSHKDIIYQYITIHLLHRYNIKVI